MRRLCQDTYARCQIGTCYNMKAGRSKLLLRTSFAAGGMTIPILGSVSCGVPLLEEENIEAYYWLPEELFGKGDFFFLRANGDSMIGAGIDDGDLVLIRRCDDAQVGQIVVALTDENENTLKRFYPEPEKNQVRLKAENPKYKDIITRECHVQGVAVKVIKDLI